MTLKGTAHQGPSRGVSDILTVLIPVYNEVLFIGEILRRVQEVPISKEIIIVDDCSTDGTREFLKRLQEHPEAHFPSQASAPMTLKIVFHEKNQGKGAAIRTGIAHATGQITIIQDADLEYDPTDYVKLLKPIQSGHADVVYGSRFRGETARIHFFWHAVANKMLTLFSNILTDLNLTDMETGYKMFRTSILQSIPIRSNRFGFEPEITAKLAKLRCRIYEVPISYYGRSYEEGKKITAWDGVKAIFVMLWFWLVDDLYGESAGLRTLRIMEGAGAYNRWLFDQCKPHLGEHVLEVGAGVGNITKLLLHKPSVVVTDFSDEYVSELRSKFWHFQNLKIAALDLTKEDSVKRFGHPKDIDTILSMNMLEHIENDQLAVKHMYSLLPAKGRLVILVPAHAWLFSEMDRHLGHFRRYTKNSLSCVLENAGFKVIRSRYLNWIGAIGWFVNGRLLRKKLIPSRQIRLFDLIILLLGMERYVSPPFGLSVLIIAEKP